MDKLSIRIVKSGIFQRIELLTGYLGAKNYDSPEDFDRVSVISLDYPMLDLLVEESVMRINAALSNADVAVEIVIANDDDSENPVVDCDSVERGAAGYVMTWVSSEAAGRWLEIVGERDIAQEIKSRLEHIGGGVIKIIGDSLSKESPKIALSRRLSPI